MKRNKILGTTGQEGYNKSMLSERNERIDLREVGSGFIGDTLYGIRPDAAFHIGYSYGSTAKWEDPIIKRYGEHMVRVGNNWAYDTDMLSDNVVILDAWRNSELNNGYEKIKPGETAFGIVVLKEETFFNSRINGERKDVLHQKYGVVPLDEEHVLFQGLLRDVREDEAGYEYNPESLVFQYMPKNWAKGEGDVDPLLEVHQKMHAVNYLLKRHPKNLTITPFELLVSR